MRQLAGAGAGAGAASGSGCVVPATERVTQWPVLDRFFSEAWRAPKPALWPMSRDGTLSRYRQPRPGK